MPWVPVPVSTPGLTPPQPQRNAYIERCNRTVRQEWRDQYIIDTIEEADRYSRPRGCSCGAVLGSGFGGVGHLSRELGINPKTVAKWRKRATVEDMKTGPTEPRSTVLSETEEAMIVAFLRLTLLPMDVWTWRDPTWSTGCTAGRSGVGAIIKRKTRRWCH